MSKAPDIEEIVERLSHYDHYPDLFRTPVKAGELRLLIADWRAKKAEIKKFSWQPIETAPKAWDEWILVARAGGKVWMARWFENYRYRDHPFLPYRAYFSSSDEADFPASFRDEEDFATAQPTHWMPLPERPK